MAISTTPPNASICSHGGDICSPPIRLVSLASLANNGWRETIFVEYTAMTPDQLRQHLYQKPFQPFRVHLKDGRSYEIRHPNLGLAAESVFIVGIPAPDDPDPVYSDRQVWVQWDQVDRIEPLSKSAAPAS